MLLFQTVTSDYAQYGDAENARAMSAYMKNRYPFFGIKTPLRKARSKLALKLNGQPPRQVWEDLCDRFFEAPQRELHYFVGDWLRPQWKMLPADFLPQCEKLILNKSWWDTVDWIAPRLVGGIVLNHPELKTQYLDRWVTSDNIWLQRSALIHQLHFKTQTDEDRLFDYCQRLAKSDEFFVQKGMGWALREHSRTSPSKTLAFLNDHNLPRLTQREARRWLVRAGLC